MNLTKRQNEIITAALILIAEGGITNLTIKNLSKAMGITEPAIYRHFSNKSEIIKTMIQNFSAMADDVITGSNAVGLPAIEQFVKSRFQLVSKNPPLAKVMFAEELFMDSPEYSVLILKMMHSHRETLRKMFIQAQTQGQIRKDIEVDMLFRIIFGSVRLLIKQWGMSNQTFDLKKEGNELWNTLEKILK